MDLSGFVSMAGSSSSSYRLAADDYSTRYPHKSSSGGNRRPPSLEEMLSEIPPGETAAYYKKCVESEGFDVSGFHRAYLYGTICPYPILNDEDRKKLTKLAKKALDLYNQDNDSSYEFVEVIRASWEVIAGFVYYITFVVKKSSSTTTNQTKQTFETSNFQALVICQVQKPVVVDFCRPEGTGKKPLPQSPMELLNAESLLYRKMFTESEGFDVPDLNSPLSSEVPNIFRPMKYPDDVEMITKLSYLAADHYSKEMQVSCNPSRFLKANKRVRLGQCGDDYHIELWVRLENGKYQTVQARVSWNRGEEPCVELCRKKPQTETMEYPPWEDWNGEEEPCVELCSKKPRTGANVDNGPGLSGDNHSVASQVGCPRGRVPYEGETIARGGGRSGSDRIGRARGGRGSEARGGRERGRKARRGRARRARGGRSTNVGTEVVGVIADVGVNNDGAANEEGISQHA